MTSLRRSLKQHADLCGIYGVREGHDVGTAAAINEAGKTGQVYLVSSGSGRQAAAGAQPLGPHSPLRIITA
jgi:ABC-type sugar transport system substrate-binding protein